jgi:hypothetical protein
VKQCSKKHIKISGKLWIRYKEIAWAALADEEVIANCVNLG